MQPQACFDCVRGRRQEFCPQEAIAARPSERARRQITGKKVAALFKLGKIGRRE